MTTTASTGARIAPTTQQSSSWWPARIALLDYDGRMLSEANVLEQTADGSVSLGEVARPNALLDYYFGKSARRLMVDLGDLVIDGWLETRWADGKRIWWVEPSEDSTS